MKRLCTLEQFAESAELRDGQTVGIATQFAGALDEIGENRQVRYTFSTGAVGRDFHIVEPDAWQLRNFSRNPVFLWAHDDSLPPIGRVIEIGDVNGALKGTVEYAAPELNPFAETIYQLVKNRFLNATSTSWQPMEWRYSKDRSRPGGIDFTKVDLLEISQVPIPALPDALAEARRSFGIDTGPLYQWAERMLDCGGMLMVPRSELEQLRRSAQMSTKVVKPENSAVTVNVVDPPPPVVAAEPAAAVTATAPAAEMRSAPEATTQATTAAVTETRNVTSPPEATVTVVHQPRAAKKKPPRSPNARRAPRFRRGLYECGQLGYLLAQLGYVHQQSILEEALEGDEDSELPRLLGEALQAAAESFREMVDEEVEELLEQVETGDEELAEGERAFVARAPNPRIRAFRRGIASLRAGRALSNAKQEKLAQADGHCDRALKHHRAQAEHHEAVDGHIEDVRAAHKRAVQTLADLGYDHHRASDAMEAISDHVDELADRHADAKDSHSMVGRSVKNCQRCVRSVLDETAPVEREEEPETAPIESREARLERARKLKAV